MKNQTWMMLCLCLLTGCTSTKKLEGLWQIAAVSMGKEQMTPLAKWTRLNSDQTFESGNGWSQHTIGQWEYLSGNNELRLASTNGTKDEYGGFQIVALKENKMTWQRTEEGQLVSVELEKIEKIPQAPFDQLLGVWKLTESNDSPKSSETAYLFLRWDKIAVIGRASEGKKYATFRTHGHKQELQIIYYEQPLRREIWGYTLEHQDALTLERQEAGQSIYKKYERIDYVPN
ncbi:MAG: hypothetical protein AAF798_05285 [Bacteroidota bacterium]